MNTLEIFAIKLEPVGISVVKGLVKLTTTTVVRAEVHTVGTKEVELIFIEHSPTMDETDTVISGGIEIRKKPPAGIGFTTFNCRLYVVDWSLTIYEDGIIVTLLESMSAVVAVTPESVPVATRLPSLDL